MMWARVSASGAACCLTNTIRRAVSAIPCTSAPALDTPGTPISILVWNTDAKPQHYAPFQHLYRPSHADYAYDAKYGIRNWQGGGRASARETIGRVAAGAIAKKKLRGQWGTGIIGNVKQIQKIYADVDPTTVTQEQVEANIVRCPDAACAAEMIAHIDWARRQGDSLGG